MEPRAAREASEKRAAGEAARIRPSSRVGSLLGPRSSLSALARCEQTARRVESSGQAQRCWSVLIASERTGASDVAFVAGEAQSKTQRRRERSHFCGSPREKSREREREQLIGLAASRIRRSLRNPFSRPPPPLSRATSLLSVRALEPRRARVALTARRRIRIGRREAHRSHRAPVAPFAAPR